MKDPLQFPESITGVELEVGADQIEAYGKLTADFNLLHFDEDFAAKTPFGGTIVHGTLALNLLLNASTSLNPPLEVKTLDVRFTAPCPRGEKLSARLVLKDLNRGQYDVWVERSDGVRVIEGTAELSTPDGATSATSKQKKVEDKAKGAMNR